VSPSDPIQGAEVGSAQTIQCIVSTDSGSSFGSVVVSWTGPGGDSILNDSRVTVATSFDGSSYTSSIQFAYLMEGDEGTYTCNVTSSSGVNGVESIEIDTLTSKLCNLVLS